MEDTRAILGPCSVWPQAATAPGTGRVSGTSHGGLSSIGLQSPGPRQARALPARGLSLDSAHLQPAPVGRLGVLEVLGQGEWQPLELHLPLLATFSCQPGRSPNSGSAGHWELRTTG